MAQAYVLLNCELGAEEEIIGKLKELENLRKYMELLVLMT